MLPKDLLHFALVRAIPFIDDREFRLLNSRPSLKKRSIDASFEIHFNGWKWNRSGEDAKFQMVAVVQSKALKTWRNSQPIPVKAMFDKQDGYIAARAFNDPKSDDYYSWDLVDVKNDNTAIARLVDVVNQEVLPFFDGCLSLESFTDLGLSPGIWGASLVELALSKDDRMLAVDIAQKVVDELSSTDRRVLNNLLSSLNRSDFPQVTGTRHSLGFMAGVILLNDLPISVQE
jgi:hypothetical protein